MDSHTQVLVFVALSLYESTFNHIVARVTRARADYEPTFIEHLSRVIEH